MQYPIGLREIINDESASDRKVSGVFVFGGGIDWQRGREFEAGSFGSSAASLFSRGSFA
jgi:hypothetical protein